MVKYNFLKGNESDFPHIDNVNTYKYDNDFDYGRFDAPQMELMLCSVPWDMGEAHIGNRTISGIGNVVYFETKEERDKWFDAISDDECYRFTTKFKELHRSLEIDVPIPYDMCARHNYLVVRYAKFANDDSPVMYEGNGGLREWFWFVREVEFLAPNTTRLHLLDDAFQTWIYDINVSGMVLERGHAPMFGTRATEYLENPIEHCENLLTDDVNFGATELVSHIDVLSFNSGTVYACISTTGNVTGGSWGSKSGSNWKVPASASYNGHGVPSVFTFAMKASDLSQFLANVTADYPQFKQTVQGVFFASADLLTLGDSFVFANVNCMRVTAKRKKMELSRLGKEMFGYPERYAELAKLYTSPYSHIEITDENGNVDTVKIEDTDGKLDVSVALSLAYPFITINAHVLGAGGQAERKITFRNIDSRSFDVKGQWYETLRTWQVPTFAVVLDPARENDYSTYFDRQQAVTDYSTAQSNANASANTITANANIATATNSAVTAASNTSAAASYVATLVYNVGSTGAANDVVDTSATSTIQANEQQAAISATAGAINSAVGAIGAAATGNIAGAVSGVISGVVGAGSTLASAAVAAGLTQALADAQKTSNNNQSHYSNKKTDDDIQAQMTCQNAICAANNSNTSGQAANNAATQIANASRTASAAQSAIDNGISQAALRTPFIYGSFANGDSAIAKPIAMFAHVVTQSKGAIARAGDEFMRYGYQYDGQWEFDGNWNIGKYFTYWKLRDFWVSNLNVPDMYMDKIRFFLFGGVTIWRKPEYIGKVSVYDNFN